MFKKEYKEFDKTLNMNWTYDKLGEKYFKDRIIENNGFVEVAERNGKIIGYLCGGIVKGLSYRKKARYAELENIMIEEKFRGQWIGTKLSKDFINWCINKKIDYINVSASAENNHSVNFYKRLGFKNRDLILMISL